MPWTVYSEMGHLYYNYTKAQEPESRREQKKYRSLRSGRTRVQQHLRDVADPLHTGIHSSLCLHKTCTRLGGSEFYHRGGRGS